MSSSTDITRIETGDLLIEQEADGDIVIRNLADGTPIFVGNGRFRALGPIQAPRNITMEGVGQILDVESETIGIGWELDSAVAGNHWAKLQFDDASGDNIYWTSNRNSNDAFRVHNPGTGNRLINVNDGGLVEIPSGDITINGGTTQTPRGAPTTAELADGERMQYVSDGSDGNSAGDVVSARNNAGTIVSQVVIAAANDA